MKKLLLVMAFAAIVFSCSKDSESQKPSEPEKVKYEFSFDGKEYVAYYSYGENGEVIWDEFDYPEFEEAFSPENYRTIIKLDGKIEIIKNEWSEDDFKEFEEVETKMITAGLIKAYESVDCYNHLFDHPFGYPNARCLEQINEFNDRITSLYLSVERSIYQPVYNTACYFTFYQDIKYRGYAITFEVREYVSPTIFVNSLTVRNLRDYPLYPGSTQTWDKTISSIYISYGTY